MTEMKKENQSLGFPKKTIIRMMRQYADQRVSEKSADEMKWFLEDLLEKITKSANLISLRRKKKTIMQRDVATAEEIVMKRKLYG